MIKSGDYKFIVTGHKGRRYYADVHVEEENDKLVLSFGYNPQLVAEVKNMEGARWNPETKKWTIPNSVRNHFTIRFLMGEDVYTRFDAPLAQVTPTRKEARDHQKEMISHGLSRRQCILAAEMGTGKTLAAIEIMERYPHYTWWYVSTRSGLQAVKLEFLKWNCLVKPVFYTYDVLRNVIQNWQNGTAPQGIIFDESSKLKNSTTKRSQACRHITKSMLEEHGDECFIILMSGSPAPKAPTDWWHQCEMACPGFLKEGNEIKLKKRLALIVERDSSVTGTMYPHLVTWWDDENKCSHCGQLKDAPNHTSVAKVLGTEACTFTPSKNEVAYLYERMKGLVLVKFKKDCLDLPPKVYMQRDLEPSATILRIAETIAKTSKSTLDALLKLRELSDGFQYRDQPTGKKIPCPVCGGSKVEKIPLNKKGQPYDYQREVNEREDKLQKLRDYGVSLESEEAKAALATCEEILDKDANPNTIPCKHCHETGSVDEITRVAKMVECPKDEALLDIMEEKEDLGRLVVYAGFTGSIDRIVELVKKAGWDYLRMDGRGTEGKTLEEFQRIGTKGPDKVVFIGHPGSAGMGLTLTEADTIVYWSNDFNAESRIQSEDRIHRMGMKDSATIVDLIHLPTDTIVLNNLKKKRELQALTLGELEAACRMTKM